MTDTGAGTTPTAVSGPGLPAGPGAAAGTTPTAASGLGATELTVTVGPIAHGGHCVARHQGRVIFVRHAAPGERVRIQLTGQDEGASFWRADVVEVLEASPDRVPHFWEPADALRAADSGHLPVGGAELGHLSRSAQRTLKETVLREQLQRLSGLGPDRLEAHDLLPSSVEDVDAGTPEADGLGWRTRTGFAVTANGRLGMHAHRSTTVLPVQHMPLAVAGINDLRLWEVDLHGLIRVEVAAPANGSAPLVLLAPDAALSPKAAGQVLKRVSQQILQGAPTAVSVAGWDPDTGQVTPLRGRGWVAETAVGHDFRVSGEGFWQIHRRAPEVLPAAALGFLQERDLLPPGAAVADLYAGAGLFTAALADAVGPDGAVLSVEGSPGASRDARKNLHAAHHVDIQQGRVERVLHGQQRRFDAIVLDPPRAGAGKTVVRQLLASGPRGIAYVSCDPASFARDVGYFRAAGWELAALRAFDLYPHTHHLETVALLLPGAGS